MKRYIKIALSIAALLIIIFVIYPFFNTGLILDVNPDDANTLVNSSKYTGDINLRLPMGEYNLVATSKGFEKLEQKVNIKFYGKTKLKIDLKKKAIIPEVPYYPENESFWIEGIYDKTGVPLYEVHYANEKEKQKALNWLKEKNISESNSNISFVLDGD